MGALLPFLLVLAGWPIHSKIIPFSSPNIVASEGDIKLVSFNAYYGRNLSDVDESLLPKLLKESKLPDIICLQEHTPLVQEWMDRFFNYGKPVRSGQYRTAIYSRHDIVNQGFMEFGNLDNGCIWADIRLPDKRIIRIYNIHLQTNGITDLSSEILQEKVEFSESYFRRVIGMLRFYRRASAKRVDQLNQILEHAEVSPYPVIIAGDINDVPISYVYRKLSIGRFDSFLERGSGLGTTYAGNIPLLRIDVIKPDQNFRVLSHEVIRGNFSDHYPVVSTLRIRG
jgi:vancomycin resistance protein VanJ